MPYGATGYMRLSRSPGLGRGTSGQWLIGRGLFVTGGAGYYHSTRPRPAPPSRPATGYAYGNVGVGYEAHLAAGSGYFVAQNAPRPPSPTRPQSHLAVTLAGTFDPPGAH